MTRHEPRLEMKPDGAATGSVDGGWWPRTLDPMIAFPELVSVLEPWVGPVSRIAYSDSTATVEPGAGKPRAATSATPTDTRPRHHVPPDRHRVRGISQLWRQTCSFS